MYFDFSNYRKVLAFAWSQKEWPGRNRILFRLLLVVPPLTVVHAVCFALDYVFYPALWRQQVKSPVFIIGHARSGTTLMHRLMAADADRFSYFLYWETFFPALTEKAIVRAIGWLDSRLFSGALHRRLVSWDEKTFGRWRHIHSQGLWMPEEDLFVMQAAFVPQQWTLELPLIHEMNIFGIDDLSARRRRRWMHHYRECVKRQLLRNGGARIHLSKNPVMSGWVNALIEAFPDARFVVMVRDPGQCIPSTLRMVETAWQQRKWSRHSYSPSLQALTRISFDSFSLPTRVLSQHPETRHIFVDYRELVDAPAAVIEATYAALGLPLSDDYRRILAEQASREKQHTSQFRYDLDDYEVTAMEIEERLDEFYRRYRWPRAHAQQPRGEHAP